MGISDGALTGLPRTFLRIWLLAPAANFGFRFCVGDGSTRVAQLAEVGFVHEAAVKLYLKELFWSLDSPCFFSLLIVEIEFHVL
jgi:hypothetical protein